ncbi:MAG TPA: GDSL-type esterase/lipase family protein [Pseudonocardiaceae bacterium]|jgi:lysophospholipase L1-like esterase|nr:GDSL-type esterase/lipase family protein [Pseudonocardiaceae bacterium]
MSEAKLTVCGDSCAEGRGGTVRPDGSFAGFVAQMAEVLGISDGVVNLGSFGATTQDVVDHQLPTALRNPAPLMGVIVGGNDLVTDYQRDRFQRNLRHIFTSLVQPGRLVFTTNWPSIPDRLPGIPDAHRVVLRGRFAEANEFFAELVQELGVICLDMVNAPISADPAMWSADGMHPSSAGHKAIGTAMADLTDEASAFRIQPTTSATL